MPQQKPFPRLKHGVPAFLADWINKAADWCEENRPLDGVNINLTDAPGKGKQIDCLITAQGGAAKTYTPFQVITRPKPNAKKTYQFAVLPGTLNNSYNPKDMVTISNISTGTTGTALKWNDWNGSADCVFLSASVDLTMTPSVTTCEVDSSSGGGSFNTTANAWQPDAYVQGTVDPSIGGTYDQNDFNFPLAFINSDANGLPIVTQNVTSNLVMQNFIIAGSNAIYPVPY